MPKNLDAIRTPTRNRTAFPARDISELPVCKEVLSLAECASLLHTTPATIRRLIRTDALPCRKVGNSFLFSANAVLQWLDYVNETVDTEEE